MINEVLNTKISENCDVLVCGGGFAGISAALAAARQGKKTILLEKEFILGGLGTAGLVTMYLPLCDGMGRQVSFGIAEEHKYFEDSVGMVSDWRKRGPVYEVPFRTLYSGKIKNLITAGRCTSVTDSMWDIMRVIPCCAVTGQAAGTAAAMTDDFTKLDVKKLQCELEANGVVLHENQL